MGVTFHLAFDMGYRVYAREGSCWIPTKQQTISHPQRRFQVRVRDLVGLTLKEKDEPPVEGQVRDQVSSR